MINHEIQTKIDNYLLSRMSEAECKDFEAEIETDRQLKETVELKRLLVTVIQQRAFIAEIIKETKISKHKPNHIQLSKVMLVAWFAVVIFIAVFFISNAVQNPRMESIYTANYSSPKTSVMRGDKMRAEDTAVTDYLQTLKYFENKQPKQAKEILLKLYKITGNFNRYEAVRWYLALNELKLHHKSNAKRYLNELLESEFYTEKVKKVLEEL